MKRIKISTCLLLSFLLNSAVFCQNNDKFAIIYGDAKILSGEEINVGRSKTKVLADGSFLLKIDLDSTSFLRFSYSTKSIKLFLRPNDSIFVNLEHNDIQLSGPGAPINNFLQAFINLAKRNSKFLDFSNKLVFGSELQQFDRIIDSLESTEIQLLNSFTSNYPDTPAEFINHLNIDTDYRHRRYKLLYTHNYHRHSGYKRIAPVPIDYHDRIMKGSFSNPELLHSSEYINCVNKYLDIMSVGKFKLQHLEFASNKRIDNRYDIIVDEMKDKELRSFFIKEHFNLNIWTYRIEALDYSYQKVMCDSSIIESVKKEISTLYRIGHTRRNEANDIKIYRSLGNVELKAHIFFPEGFQNSENIPAHLFFHGGGWAMGMPEWSYDACKKAASNGLVSIAFDYRLRNVDGTDIRASVSDALAAIAWVRENSKSLGVNPNKILVEGFSAGAHLALTAAMIKNPKDFGVVSKYSSRPNALILGSTPYDVTFRDAYNVNYDPSQISPIYLIRNNLPPMLIFHAEKDHMVDFSEFERFIDLIKTTNNELTYYILKGADHFYNGASKKDLQVIENMKKDFIRKLK